jgi:hypothetical protein
MSGSIYYVTVANGTDTTRFKMINTFDYTALKIVNIINQYLPSDNNLWASEELIKQEKESREWFNQAGDEREKEQLLKTDSGTTVNLPVPNENYKE